MVKTFVVLLVIFGSMTALEAQSPETTVDRLRQLLTEHLSTPRHHITNPVALNVAEDFIYDTFKSYNMQTFKHTFHLEKDGVNYQGSNVIGVWPGRRTMTSLDRPVLLTAHYDTPYEMPALEDNGGGLAALLEAARILSSHSCLRDYTMFFAAFDYAANYERSYGSNSPCQEIGCGCRAFLEEILLPFVNESGFPVENFQGAFVMDGVLNYNNTPGAQTIPAENIFKTIPGFKDTYDEVVADGYRGNFIVSISRQQKDAPLVSAFHSKHAQAGSPQFKSRGIEIPHMDVFGPQAQSDPYWPVYRTVIDADVYGFYKVHPELKATLITDSVHLRGRETIWGALTPADAVTLTEDRLGFLKKTTDTLMAVLQDMAGHHATCKDEFPAGFKQGLKLDGTLHLNANTRQNVSLLVKSAEARGFVQATLTSPSMALELSGRYDPEEQQVALRFQEPHKIAPGPMTVTCTMIGKVLPFKSGLVYMGEMRGVCGDKMAFDQSGYPNSNFVLFNAEALGASAASTSAGGNAVPVVLALIGGIAFTAAAAVIAFIVYKKRVSGATTTNLVMNENKA